MHKWRPERRIRVKAIGLHWRDGNLLAAEVLNDQGQVKGVRPLGGGVEFGECWQAALVREFKEELGVDVEVIGGPHIMENIYLHEGAAGHEIVFIGEVMFPAEVFAGRDSITFLEDSGVACTARWYDVAKLDLAGGPALYPSGLKERLLNTGAPSESGACHSQVQKLSF